MGNTRVDLFLPLSIVFDILHTYQIQIFIDRSELCGHVKLPAQLPLISYGNEIVHWKEREVKEKASGRMGLS